MPIRYPVPLGPRGSSNGRVLRGLRSGKIGYTVAFRHFYECRVRFGRGEFTPAAATSQVLTLSDWSAYGYKPFPAPVRRLSPAYIFVETGITGTGITGATASLGDADDDDELLTASSVLPAAANTLISTSGAAAYAAQIEDAYEPVLRIALTGGGSPQMPAITGGELWVVIPFEPMPVRG